MSSTGYPNMLGADIGVIYPRRTHRRARLHIHWGVYLFAAVAVFFMIALGAFILSLPHRAAASPTIGAPDVAAAVPAVAVAGTSPVLEMHIANNGLVLLRGARVVSVQGNTLTVSMAWGTENFLWTVQAPSSAVGTHNFGTVFLNQDGQTIAPAAVQAGDWVIITGMLETNAKSPTIDADTIRTLN